LCRQARQAARQASAKVRTLHAGGAV
jgi:hypothetical protein